MTEEQMEMSLDDIIKAKPSLVKRGGRRQGGGGGSAAGNSSGRGRGSGGNSRGGGGGRRGGNRQTPYSRDTPSGRWDHDKFEGGSRTGGRLGVRGGGRGGTKLIISNLEYSVNDQDIRELFSEFGAIRSYSVHFDRSGRSLGTADVMYVNRTDALKALKTYNNVPLDGKPMFIEMVSDEPVYQPPAARPYSSGGGGGYNRSRGGNRGGRGQKRGGGGEKREKKKPMTAEELDAQLDEYKKTA